MFWLVLACIASAQASPTRLCVPESLSGFCSQMAGDLADEVSCVTSPDAFGCVAKVAASEADVANVDAFGLYLAGKFFHLEAVVMELVDGNPHRYEGVALVQKGSDIHTLADLRGKRSCHTGYRRTVGWQIPVAQLLQNGIAEPSCAESDLAVISGFFGGSCLPGNWSKDEIVDAKLKERYPNLCSQCKDPETCSQDDTFAGYEGVLRCLEDGRDVAFTKVAAVRKYAQEHSDFAENYELLCLDGERKDIFDPEPCTWGRRPTNAYIARTESEEEIEKHVTTLLNIQTRYSVAQARTPEWYYKSFLSRSDSSGIRRVEEDKKTYESYLGDFLHAIKKPRPNCFQNDDVKFCVTSEAELLKCQDYSRAAEARGLWPGVQCVRTASKAACMEVLKEGHAHLLVLDGGDAYKAGRYYGLQPVAGELYNGSDATYYAVALVRSASDVAKVSDLKGLRSCHTGIGRTAGWVMPLGVLLAEEQIAVESCDRVSPVAAFFSSGSCVPGANDTKYNPSRLRSEDLCRHCIGDGNGEHRCARDSKERFSGYAGALRCLAEGKGDVAFVKHTTIPDYTDGHSQLPWAKDLISSDFKLLCSGTGTAAFTDYLDCNWGKVPSHQVVAKLDSLTAEQHLQLATVLADSSQYFSRESQFFKLFLNREGPDLMFKDSATGLKVNPFDSTYEQVLGRRFLEASIAADPKDCM